MPSYILDGGDHLISWCNPSVWQCSENLNSANEKHQQQVLSGVIGVDKCEDVTVPADTFSDNLQWFQAF